MTQYPAPIDQVVRCDRPGPGWYCTRSCGHEGPCAAIPEYPRWRKMMEAIIENYGHIGLAAFIAIEIAWVVQAAILVFLFLG